MSWNHTQDYEQTTYQDYGARLGGGQFEKIWDLGESPLPPRCHWHHHWHCIVIESVQIVLLPTQPWVCPSARLARAISFPSGVLAAGITPTQCLQADRCSYLTVWL